MTWTLLIVVLNGSMISTHANFTPIPMRDKAACVAAGNHMARESKGPIGYLCISSETGEVLKFAPVP